jgi:GTP-binding protein Era
MSAFRCGTVALAGRPNTGKSSLLNKLVGQKIAIVSPKAQTTRHTVTGILTTADCQYVFVDLPGYQTRHVNVLNRSLNRQATEGARDCDVAVFVVEATRFGSPDREVLARIPAGQRIVVAVNKVDLVKHQLELLPFLERLQKERDFAAIVPVSARTGKNLPELLRVVAELLPEGAFSRRKSCAKNCSCCWARNCPTAATCRWRASRTSRPREQARACAASRPPSGSSARARSRS